MGFKGISILATVVNVISNIVSDISILSSTLCASLLEGCNVRENFFEIIFKFGFEVEKCVQFKGISIFRSGGLFI